MNVPGWDEYFIKMAQLVATKSKDRSTQVGVVLVGEGRSILSTGFNGFPRGCRDDLDERHERPAKYFYTSHAELNCLTNAAREGVKTLGSTMYMSFCGYPCADCARAIIQSGVAEIVSVVGVFDGKGDLWKESCKRSKEMLMESGIRITKLHGDFTRVSCDLNDIADIAYTK